MDDNRSLRTCPSCEQTFPYAEIKKRRWDEFDTKEQAEAAVGKTALETEGK